MTLKKFFWFSDHYFNNRRCTLDMQKIENLPSMICAE